MMWGPIALAMVAVAAGDSGGDIDPFFRARGKISPFTFDSRMSEYLNFSRSRLATTETVRSPFTGVDRTRRQSGTSTATCRFEYGMTTVNGRCRESCTMNIPGTWFTNLEYGVDRLSLSCGLPASQCYPGGVDAAGNHVGCCSATCPSSPSFGGRRLAVGGLASPLNASQASSSLVRYPVTDMRVIFYMESWRLMTPYTRQKLTKLADLVENNITGGEALAIIVTDGYMAPGVGYNFTGETSLTWEGRELGLVIGRRPRSQAELNAQRDAVLTPNQTTVPAAASVLFWSDLHVRQLAEVCWSAGFNWLENSGRSSTDSWVPHVQAASVQRTCGGSLDLAFLLDGSGSVELNGWKDELTFVLRVAGRFRVSSGGTHVAVSTFGGPRERDGSHFQAGFDAPNISTGEPCNVNSQCHDFSTPHVVERCSVNHGDATSNGTCFRLEPAHCPIGTIHATVDGSTVCMCPINRTCLSTTTGQCRQARYNTSGCAGNTCSLHWYFNESCTTCSCNLTASDFRWVRSHSAWTDIPFSAGTALASLNASIHAGMNQYCPSLTSPAWASKQSFCYPNAATHLSYGLREVYESVFTGARAPSEGKPRVLISISDGLANSFMEADEWAAQLKRGDPSALPVPLPGVEMVSVGTADEGGNYIPQLTELASAPVDRHMFRVSTPSDLQELVDEIGQVACAATIQLRDNITIVIDDPSDPGVNYFEFACDGLANSTVTVVVESAGESEVIVANVVNPTLADHGIMTSRASGRNAVTIRATTDAVYAAVVSPTTYTISVFLNTFVDDETTVRLPWFPQSDGFVLYSPTMLDSSQSYTFTLRSNPWFRILDSSTGAIGLTSAGAAALFDQANRPVFLGTHTVELESTTDGGCAPGLQIVRFTRTLDDFTWGMNDTARNSTNVTGLEEFTGDGCPYFNSAGIRNCGWPRRAGAIPASIGAIIVGGIVLSDASNLSQMINYTLSTVGSSSDTPFALSESRRITRRHRRLASVAAVDLVVNQPNALLRGRSWTVDIVAEVPGLTYDLPSFTVSVPSLLSTSTAPYIDLAGRSSIVTVMMHRAPTSSQYTTTVAAMIPVRNPSTITYNCVVSTRNSFSVNLAGDGSGCELSHVPLNQVAACPGGAAACTFNETVNISISIGAVPMLPEFTLTVQVQVTEGSTTAPTSHPTAAPTYSPTKIPTATPTVLPSTQSPTSVPSSAPTETLCENLNLGGGMGNGGMGNGGMGKGGMGKGGTGSAPTCTPSPTLFIEIGETGTTDTDDDDSNILWAIVGAVIFCLMVAAFLILVVLPRRRKNQMVDDDGVSRIPVVKNAVYQSSAFSTRNGLVANQTYAAVQNTRGGVVANDTYQTNSGINTNPSTRGGVVANDTYQTNSSININDDENRGDDEYDAIGTYDSVESTTNTHELGVYETSDPEVRERKKTMWNNSTTKDFGDDGDGGYLKVNGTHDVSEGPSMVGGASTPLYDVGSHCSVSGSTEPHYDSASGNSQPLVDRHVKPSSRGNIHVNQTYDVAGESPPPINRTSKPQSKIDFDDSSAFA